MFRLANVDVDRAEAVPKAELWALMREASESGRYELPRIEGSVHRTPQAGVMMALMTRMRNVDATDAEQLTRAEIEGRRQATSTFASCARTSPATRRPSSSRRARRSASARAAGSSASTCSPRTRSLSAAQFPDQIALCGAPIEDHHAGSDTRWVYLEDGAAYGIPYRCLLPREVDRLLVAGRCFSATHDAHASARSMATCMAMGQAAGTAAALSIAEDVEPRALPADTLRARLVEDGADVGDRAHPG